MKQIHIEIFYLLQHNDWIWKILEKGDLKIREAGTWNGWSKFCNCKCYNEIALPLAPMEEVKRRIAEVTGLESSRQTLCLKGKTLKNDGDISRLSSGCVVVVVRSTSRYNSPFEIANLENVTKFQDVEKDEHQFFVPPPVVVFPTRGPCIALLDDMGGIDIYSRGEDEYFLYAGSNLLVNRKAAEYVEMVFWKHNSRPKEGISRTGIILYTLQAAKESGKSISLSSKPVTLRPTIERILICSNI